MTYPSIAEIEAAKDARIAAGPPPLDVLKIAKWIEERCAKSQLASPAVNIDREGWAEIVRRLRIVSPDMKQTPISADVRGSTTS